MATAAAVKVGVAKVEMAEAVREAVVMVAVVKAAMMEGEMVAVMVVVLEMVEGAQGAWKPYRRMMNGPSANFRLWQCDCGARLGSPLSAHRKPRYLYSQMQAHQLRLSDLLAVLSKTRSNQRQK